MTRGDQWLTRAEPVVRVCVLISLATQQHMFTREGVCVNGRHDNLWKKHSCRQREDTVATRHDLAADDKPRKERVMVAVPVPAMLEETQVYSPASSIVMPLRWREPLGSSFTFSPPTISCT